jgi:hypothetical protein
MKTRIHKVGIPIAAFAIASMLVAAAVLVNVGVQQSPVETSANTAPNATSCGYALTGTLTVQDVLPPKAIITFDTTTRQIVVYGEDNLDPDVEVTSKIVEEKENKEIIYYTLTDDSGNSIGLLLEHKDRAGNKDIRVLEVMDFVNEPMVLQENHYKVEFKVDKKTNEIKHLHQNIYVENEFKVNTHYKDKDDETKIHGALEGEPPEKFVEEGLQIVKLIIIAIPGMDLPAERYHMTFAQGPGWPPTGVTCECWSPCTGSYGASSCSECSFYCSGCSYTCWS